MQSHEAGAEPPGLRVHWPRLLCAGGLREDTSQSVIGWGGPDQVHFGGIAG